MYIIMNDEIKSRGFIEECEDREFERIERLYRNSIIQIQGGIVQILQESIKILSEYKKKSNEFIYFVTVNPKPEVTLQQMISVMDKPRKIYSNGYYTFEQRGTTEEDSGKGVHMHLITDINNSNRKDFLRELYRIWKPYVGSKASIDVKKYPANFKQEKIDYMKGKKWAESKLDSVKINIKWRTENGIQDIYNIN